MNATERVKNPRKSALMGVFTAQPCVLPSPAVILCQSCTDPVCEHKISAALALPVLSQAQHMAPVPQPLAILGTS